MKTHPLVSQKHADQLQSIWEKLEISEDEIVTPSWKRLLAKAAPKDLGHYALSLMLTVGLGEFGGLKLKPKLDETKTDVNHRLLLYTLAEVFSTKKAEFIPDQLEAMLEDIEFLPSHASNQVPYGWLVVGGLKPHFVNDREVTPELKIRMRQLRKNMNHIDSGYGKYVAMIERLLGDASLEHPVLWRSDAWMTKYCEIAEGFDQQQTDSWNHVLTTASAAKGSKPSKKYLRAIELAKAEIGEFEFVRVMRELLNSIGSDGPMKQFGFFSFMDPDDLTRLDKEYVDLLRALVWATRQHAGLTDSLGHAATACYEALTNTGARCSKVGKACLESLKSIDSTASLKLIQQVRDGAETKSAVKAIDRILNS